LILSFLVSSRSNWSMRKSPSPSGVRAISDDWTRCGIVLLIIRGFISLFGLGFWQLGPRWALGIMYPPI
jgi:hypothetical protein